MILSAAYALWLYRRVVYGELDKPALQTITDLNRREIITFAPLILLIIYYGIQPGPDPRRLRCADGCAHEQRPGRACHRENGSSCRTLRSR